eukprot:CAMPEP_0206493598 /NCGR_PEP_ID=MMETSP0324_2-20121206/47115_1 /ASSEMBLY_ACC=CAM_ASM_000836 /TAXON_ID=2866 /ORGANISM="Crypthecodinium cohnii, Strain Seligo" /LENGTH=35 /DNA_ID= /DNA_START= /DNA_END= /DNA_ORIENTATION=
MGSDGHFRTAWHLQMATNLPKRTAIDDGAADFAAA